MKQFVTIAAIVMLGFVLFSVFAANSLAQKKISPAVTKIDVYRKTIDGVRKHLKSPSLIVADTADYNGEAVKWQRFSSENELEKFRDKSEVYTIAYSWLSGGKIVASNFTLSSPSGDWAKYNYHYFRSDGTLAYIESDFRTFNGDIIVLRRRYFDTAGKQIHSTTKFLDLKSRKPKKVAGNVLGDDPNEVDYYLTTAKLPFAGLLKGK